MTVCAGHRGFKRPDRRLDKAVDRAGTTPHQGGAARAPHRRRTRTELSPRPHGGRPFGPPAEETAKVGACSVVLRPFGRTPPPRGECAADAHAAVGPRARPRHHPHHHRSCSNGDGGRLSATTPRPSCCRAGSDAGPSGPQAAAHQRAATAGARQAPFVTLTSPPVTGNHQGALMTCLLYTSDAADE